MRRQQVCISWNPEEGNSRRGIERSPVIKEILITAAVGQKERVI